MNDLTPWSAGHNSLARHDTAADLVHWTARAWGTAARTYQRITLDLQLMELRAEAEIMQDLLDRRWR